MNQASLSKVLNGTPEERAFFVSFFFALFFVYYFRVYIKYRFAPFHFEMFTDLEKMMNGQYREVVADVS